MQLLVLLLLLKMIADDTLAVDTGNSWPLLLTHVSQCAKTVDAMTVLQLLYLPEAVQTSCVHLPMPSSCTMSSRLMRIASTAWSRCCAYVFNTSSIASSTLLPAATRACSGSLAIDNTTVAECPINAIAATKSAVSCLTHLQASAGRQAVIVVSRTGQVWQGSICCWDCLTRTPVRAPDNREQQHLAQRCCRVHASCRQPMNHSIAAVRRLMQQLC